MGCWNLLRQDLLVPGASPTPEGAPRERGGSSCRGWGCGEVGRTGRDFLFFPAKVGGVRGCQLAMGSISTDKALPCRCEEFQLNIQPICLCVGEGLLCRRKASHSAPQLTIKREISSVHQGKPAEGFPSPLLPCSIPLVREQRGMNPTSWAAGRCSSSVSQAGKHNFPAWLGDPIPARGTPGAAEGDRCVGAVRI